MLDTSRNVREALLYERRDDKVVCNTCERHCSISNHERGFCKTRKNIDGKIYTLTYGNVSSLNANPIEKKPLFHFYPGSRALTVGSWSCNFACPWCQNWDISKRVRRGEWISPERFVELVEYYHCQGTSISFNEPTLSLEYSIDLFNLAKKRGYYNTYVTNGYMSLEALNLLIDHGLDAMNVDIKGDEKVVEKYCGANVEYVYRNVNEAKKREVHVEITTLVIPGVNDDDDCLRSIASRIAHLDVVWHLTRYYPAYEFDIPPTPISTLERGRNVGIEEGLKYVYIGNVPDHPYENTHCPSCGTLLIRRHGLCIIDNKIENGRCQRCGEEIPIRST
jgi:pyruvate formate lyase activating enzyme